MLKFTEYLGHILEKLCLKILFLFIFVFLSQKEVSISSRFSLRNQLHLLSYLIIFYFFIYLIGERIPLDFEEESHLQEHKVLEEMIHLKMQMDQSMQNLKQNLKDLRKVNRGEKNGPLDEQIDDLRWVLL